MREILFKAKRTDNGEWVEGDLRKDRDLETAYISGWNYYITEGGLEREPFEYEILPETICEYTGLTDKNGNRIWDNDIVKCNKRKDGFDLYKVLWRKYYADFGVEPLEFGVQYPISLGENEQDIHGCDYTIVGNIFDNPELLAQEGSD